MSSALRRALLNALEEGAMSLPAQRVYRVVPEAVDVARAFQPPPRSMRGVHVFTSPDDALEFQGIAGGKVVAADMDRVADRAQAIDDFAIEFLHGAPTKRGDPFVYVNDGSAELYPAGSQLYVTETNLINPDTATLLRRALAKRMRD